VVALTNCLVEALSNSNQHKLSSSSIHMLLQTYQHLRQSRAKRFIHLSGIVTRDEALDTLRHTLRFLFFPLASTELLSGDYNVLANMKFLLICARHSHRSIYRRTEVRPLANTRTAGWEYALGRYHPVRRDCYVQSSVSVPNIIFLGSSELL
jgi:hypothetical protein